jgi:hypothetical protein
MGEKRNAYRILVGKPEGNRPLGRPRRRWADNIKTDLREIGWDGMEWSGVDINIFKTHQWTAFISLSILLLEDVIIYFFSFFC